MTGLSQVRKRYFERVFPLNFAVDDWVSGRRFLRPAAAVQMIGESSGIMRGRLAFEEFDWWALYGEEEMGRPLEQVGFLDRCRRWSERLRGKFLSLV